MGKIEELEKFIENNTDKYFAHPRDRFVNRNVLLAYLNQLKSSLPTIDSTESQALNKIAERLPMSVDQIGDVLARSQLPTQQGKVVVKQYIADWYEEHRCDTLETKFRRAQVDKDKRVREWYDNCQGRHANKRANAQEVIAKIDLNGYTVEKEQLYLIKCAEDRSSDDVYLEEALWRTKNRAWAESGGTYEAVWNPSKEQCITLNKEKAEYLASLVEGIAVPVEEEE